MSDPSVSIAQTSIDATYPGPIGGLSINMITQIPLATDLLFGPANYPASF